MSDCYYVYAYLDPSRFGTYNYGEYSFNAEPYYIGKGQSAAELDLPDLEGSTTIEKVK